MKNARKCIKGFNKDLKCRDFQYEIGKTYKMSAEDVSICNSGFHAIDEDESPLSVFGYYPPADSRYCNVEVGGEIDKSNEKIVGSEITIGAEIGIPGVVKAHVEWVKRHLIDDDKHKSVNTGYQSSASNTGNRSSASNTGYQSSASNTGDYSSASNTGNQSSASNAGNRSSASNTGDYSSASNTGNRSSASNTGCQSSASNTGYRSSASNAGDRSSASNTGDYSSASNAGDRSSASNTGDQSSASNTGDYSSAEVSGKDSVAIATGYNSKARGALGCAIVVAERGKWNGETYPLIGICAAIVDGVKIKADTWYTAKNGKLVETED